MSGGCDTFASPSTLEKDIDSSHGYKVWPEQTGAETTVKQHVMFIALT